jgi:phage protein U
MFALLGEIPFEVVGSPESVESARRFVYAEHQVVEDRPRLQWIADGLETISLGMLLHVSFTNPTLQFAALLAAAEDHQARALVLGNGLFRGFFVVEEVATRDIHLGADASPIAIRASLRLREWSPGAELDPGAPPRPTTIPLGIAPLAINYSVPAPAIGASLPQESYVAPTFTEPGVSPLVNNPAPSRPLSAGLSYSDVPPQTIVRSTQ